MIRHLMVPDKRNKYPEWCRYRQDLMGNDLLGEVVDKW